MKTFEQISKEYTEADFVDQWLDTESLRQLGAVSCAVPQWLHDQIDWTDVILWSTDQYGEWGWICDSKQFWAKTPEDLALFLLRWGTP